MGSLSQLRSQAAIDNERARDREKKRRRRERKRADRAGAVLSTRTGSKTSKAYRQIMFGVAPEKSKAELRAELAQAVRNTAAQGMAT